MEELNLTSYFSKEYDESLTTGPSTSTTTSQDDADEWNRGIQVEDSPAFVSAEPSIKAACRLVKDILNQVAHRDAPPSNENLDTSQVSKVDPPPDLQKRKLCTTLTSGKMCHNDNGSIGSIDFEGLVDDETDTIPSHGPSHIWNTHHEKRRNNPSEQKLGSVSLAALCTRTLETVGMPIPEQSNPSKPGQVESVLRSISSSSTVENQNENNDQAVTTKSLWRQKTLRPTLEHLAHDTNGVKLVPTQGNGDLAKKPPGTNRLQMFGSEYARYLSSTALAPSEASDKFKGSNQAPRTRSRLTRRGVPMSIPKTKNLEDASNEVLSGAVTDILVTYGSDLPPQGYYKISQSGSRQPIELGDNLKSQLSICVKKESNWDRAAQRPCVTALTVIFPERNEFMPPGFSFVRRHTDETTEGATKHLTANLNLGGAEPVHLCFRRSREGNPITGIMPLLPSRQENVPEGYTVIESSPRNHAANIRPNGASVFLAYRQRLANLEALRPLPLVLSVSTSGKTRKLKAYYSTGGTVVESKVGRFHILDRSTHSLLSPSSISNRISLIETSRRKTYDSITNLPADGAHSTYSSSKRQQEPAVATTPEMLLASSLLMINGLGTATSQNSFDVGMSFSMDESMVTTDDIQSINLSFNSSMSITSQGATSPVAFGDVSSDASTLIIRGDKELQRCLRVMSFIPIVHSSSTDAKSLVILQSKVALLTPILTAAYTRHGGSALLAVEGLHTMLRHGFFRDASQADNATMNSSLQVTLLDLAIQAVCDVATTGAQETHLHACVEFVNDAIKEAAGILSSRTVGYILRLNLFVFYFGALTPTCGTNPVWGDRKEVDEFMLTDPRSLTVKYLPGGAPQMAVLSLKSLLSMSIHRLHEKLAPQESASDNNNNNHEPGGAMEEPEVFNGFLDDLIEEVVDEAVNRVDIANYTQLAIHQIHRSGGSELFWHDMIGMCGKGLFGEGSETNNGIEGLYALSFALLASIVKVSSSQVRKIKASESVSRDVASKLLGLELLHHFLETWAAEHQTTAEELTRSANTFAYCVRRLVIPCLLSNTKDALEDSRVYRRILRIVGVLWKEPMYRNNMKLEMGFLLDHFANKVLQIPFLHYHSQGKLRRTVLEQQIDLIDELGIWLASTPLDLMSLCINFDTSRSTNCGPNEVPLSIQWNVYQKLCAHVCSSVEYCGEFIGNQIKQSQAMTSSSENLEDQAEGDVQMLEKAKRLRESGLDFLERLLLTLLDCAIRCSGPAFASFMKDWVEADNCLDDPSISRLGPSDYLEVEDPQNTSRSNAERSILGFWENALHEERENLRQGHLDIFMDSNDSEDSVENDAGDENQVLPSARNNKHQDYSENLTVAFGIARSKSITKCIDYLVACNVLTPSPRDVASFLRLNKEKFNSAALGKYLGECGVDAAQAEHFNLVRFNFIRANSFDAMNIEQALRHLLTNGGFRLPGEAQEIDRILTAFAQCFWEDNAGDSNRCPLHDQDAVFLASFATIMLNTDLHMAGSSNKKSGKKGRKKMTLDEFCTNLQKADHGESMPRDYLRTIYEAIKNDPIVLGNGDGSEPSDDEVIHVSVSALVTNVKSIDALLRGLATQESRFLSLQDYSIVLGVGEINAMDGIARSCITKTWHLIHGLINSLLEKAHLDVAVLESCTGLLRQMMCITICLDLPMQRNAFLEQVARVRTFHQQRHSKASESVSVQQDDAEEDMWRQDINRACLRGDDLGKLQALDNLKKILGSFEPIVPETTESRESTEAAIARLEHGSRLLNDPNRTLIREGVLVKRANRSGRDTKYHFFLFSDMLIYTKPIPGSNKYKTHGELPLLMMKIVDWFPPSKKKETKRAFQVFHPRKKLLVLCSSPEERRSWVTSIRDAIALEVEQKVATEAARVSAAKAH